MVHFALGKILQIYCQNFLVYDEITFIPGEYLNLILGPNGNGKSSIVSAIILCMGGDPKLLARAVDISAYIQNGKNLALIKIQLSDGRGGRIEFQRKFGKDGKSSYQIDGVKKSKAEFCRAVAQYNIQVNNLCQFLPQERVHDFAAMNMLELFVNTLKSVCTSNVIDTFNELKSHHEVQLKEKSKEEAYKKNLSQLRSREVELKHKFDELQKHKGLLLDRDTAKMKLFWQEALLLAEDLNKVLKDMKLQEGACKKHEMEVQKRKETETQLLHELETLERSYNANANKIRLINRSLNALMDELEKLKSNIDNNKLKYVNDKRNQKELLDTIKVEQRALMIHKSDLRYSEEIVANIDMQELEANTNVCKRLIDKKQEERININNHLESVLMPEINITKINIEKEKNIKRKHMSILETRFPQLHKAVLWLNENPHMLSGHVYKPMLMEINVKNEMHIKYFEDVIPLRDLLAFTCECKSDFHLLVRELNTNRKLGVNICHSAPATECFYKADIPIEQLRQYGFSDYLLQLVEAPVPILNHLCGLHRIHLIPVGNDNVVSNSNRIPDKISLYFSTHLRHLVVSSRYGGGRSLTQRPIRQSNSLRSQSNAKVDMYEKLLLELIAERDGYRNNRTSLESEIAELQTKSSQLREQRNAFSKVNFNRERVKRQEDKVARVMASRTSIEAITQAYQEANNKAISDLNRTLLKFINGLLQQQEIHLDFAASEQLLALHNVKLKESKQSCLESQSKLNDGKAVLERIKQEQLKTKEYYEQKKKDVQELAKSPLPPTHNNFPYRQQFMKLPSALEDLRAYIRDHQARLNCLEGIDEHVNEEYEQIQADIKKLTESIENSQRAQADLESQMIVCYDAWFPEISDILETINGNFHNFMEKIGFVGEVLLQRDDEYSFQTYGILINVKYRQDEPLQALTKLHQSGGERSVAISAYLLALQHLTKVPFRCIDEINQGMDPKNERKVFSMIVDTNSQLGQSQTFVVTPKLLENLPSNKFTTIHIVTNCPI